MNLYHTEPTVQDCTFSFSTNRPKKTSRTALLFLRSFLSNAFLALFLSCGSQRVWGGER